MAERLVVVLIPEQRIVGPINGDDVVDISRSSHALCPKTQTVLIIRTADAVTTQRIAPAVRAPSRCVALTPDLHLVLLTATAVDQLGATRKRAR
jgi:hypothetical protein